LARRKAGLTSDNPERRPATWPGAPRARRRSGT